MTIRQDERKKELEELNYQLSQLERDISKLMEIREGIERKKLILKKEEETELRANIPFTDKQLNEVCSKTDAEYFFIDEEQEDTKFEDDGSIHVRMNGVRFCKDGRTSQLNAFANKIKKAFEDLK